jgi:hypothetical protein
MGVDDLFLGHVVGHPPIVVLELVNMFFLLLAFTLRWKNLVLASDATELMK